MLFHQNYLQVPVPTHLIVGTSKHESIPLEEESSASPIPQEDSNDRQESPDIEQQEVELQETDSEPPPKVGRPSKPQEWASSPAASSPSSGEWPNSSSPSECPAEIVNVVPTDILPESSESSSRSESIVEDSVPIEKGPTPDSGLLPANNDGESEPLQNDGETTTGADSEKNGVGDAEGSTETGSNSEARGSEESGSVADPERPEVDSLSEEFWKKQTPAVDHVLITDVTTHRLTVTVRECDTSSGFFKDRPPGSLNGDGASVGENEAGL